MKEVFYMSIVTISCEIITIIINNNCAKHYIHCLINPHNSIICYSYHSYL